MDRFDRYREEIDINEMPEHLRDFGAVRLRVGDRV